MKVSAGSVCALVLVAIFSIPAMAGASGITLGVGVGQVTNYVGTPAGISAGSAGDARATSGPAPESASSALEIPEPAVIALFGLVALAIGHRLRRLKAYNSATTPSA